MSTPTMQFNTRLPVEEYTLLVAIAERERISMVTVLRDAIYERAERLGLLPATQPHGVNREAHDRATGQPLESELADIAERTLAGMGGKEWDSKQKK